jgi:hypothetical protein
LLGFAHRRLATRTANMTKKTQWTEERHRIAQTVLNNATFLGNAFCSKYWPQST